MAGDRIEPGSIQDAVKPIARFGCTSGVPVSVSAPVAQDAPDSMARIVPFSVQSAGSQQTQDNWDKVAASLRESVIKLLNWGVLLIDGSGAYDPIDFRHDADANFDNQSSDFPGALQDMNLAGIPKNSIWRLTYQNWGLVSPQAAKYLVDHLSDTEKTVDEISAYLWENSVSFFDPLAGPSSYFEPLHLLQIYFKGGVLNDVGLDDVRGFDYFKDFQCAVKCEIQKYGEAHFDSAFLNFLTDQGVCTKGKVLSLPEMVRARGTTEHTA